MDLALENRGVLVHMCPPAIGETQPVALVQRDDLPGHFAPIPYHLHELAVRNLRAAA